MAGRDPRDRQPPGDGGSAEWLADGTGWQLDQYEAAFQRLERRPAAGGRPRQTGSGDPPGPGHFGLPRRPVSGDRRRGRERLPGIDGTVDSGHVTGLEGAAAGSNGPAGHDGSGFDGTGSDGSGGFDGTGFDGSGGFDGSPTFDGSPGLGLAPGTGQVADDGGSFGFDGFADDDYDDEHWQRPRTLRVVGVVLAASLLLGAVGTTIGAIFGGGSANPSLTTTVESVGPAEVPPTAASEHEATEPAQPAGRELVTFSVTGDHGGETAVVCSGVVNEDGAVVGRWSHVVALDGTDGRRQQVTVPIDRAAFAGSPADAVAYCQPVEAGSVTPGASTD